MIIENAKKIQDGFEGKYLSVTLELQKEEE